MPKSKSCKSKKTVLAEIVQPQKRFEFRICGGNSIRLVKPVHFDETLPGTAALLQAEAIEQLVRLYGKEVTTLYDWTVFNNFSPSKDDPLKFTSFIVCDKFFEVKAAKESALAEKSLLEIEEMTIRKGPTVHTAPLMDEQISVQNFYTNLRQLQSDMEKQKQLTHKLQLDMIEQASVKQQLQSDIQHLQAEMQQQKRITQQFQLDLVKQKSHVDQHAIKLDGLIAELNIPMHKIHLRVLLHYLKEHICSTLARKPNVGESWKAFLSNLSEEDLSRYGLNPEALQFAMNDFNDAARTVSKMEIRAAVDSVSQDDSSGEHWEQIFSLCCEGLGEFL